MTAEKLEQTLLGLHLPDITVRVEGRPGHLVAEVVSSAFHGMDEAIRQRRVWEHLLGTLTDMESAEVEFVVTTTREELMEMDGAESPTEP